MNQGSNLLVTLGLDPSGLRSGLNDATRSIDDASRQIRSSLDRIGDIGENIAKLGGILSASLTVPIIALGKEAIKAYGDIQALELGIEAVAGSASYAGKQMDNLREIAKLPGLGLKEAAKGSVGLQAIGYSAGNAEKILLQFGNAIATVGKGKQDFERAIYGVQQLANTDFPLGEDLNIIKDALPQVSTLLKAAFGTSRSEDLQKLKVSSKQVMDVILTGLEKLPRVSGGIKNAFENLGDSMQQNLARIGERIDKAFDISGIINKLTDLIDKAITAFEDLSPATQKTILVIAGLVAGIGPLILGIGGVLAALPLLISGFAALGTALTYLLTLLTPVNLILGVLAYGIYKYYTNTDQATENQNRLNESLIKATTAAKSEVSELEKLYKASQDHKLSLEERNKAVDQIQKQYPAYFGNLTNEAVLAGKAGFAYKQLRVDIINASRARAAQGELDKRNEDRIKKQTELTVKLKRAYEVYFNATADNLRSFNQEGLFSGDVIELGGSITDNLKASEKDIKQATKSYIKNILTEYGQDIKAANKEDIPLLRILEAGKDAILKLDTPAPDNFLPGLDKVKKEKEKQLAEIFPKGSIAELQQRADLLKKAIQTSVNDVVKVRGVDEFGKNIDKKGLPIFTGEILQLKIAEKRLEQLLAQISLLEVKPPEGITNFKAFRTEFTNELNELNKSATNFDFSLNIEDPFEKIIKNVDKLGDSIVKVTDFKNAISSNLEALSVETPAYLDLIGNSFIALPNKIGLGIDNTKVRAQDFAELVKNFNRDFESLVTNSVSGGLTSMFNSVGEAIATGGNVISAVGNGLLNLFGSFLSDMGQMLIKYGTLAIMKGTLDEIIKTGGYQAIAAGIAAIAVGAALSVAGGAIGSAAKGGMSGSVSTSSGSSATSNYSSSYASGSNFGSEVVFRISGEDLVGVLNRQSDSNYRLNAIN